MPRPAWSSPSLIFSAFAAVGGLLLAALIPPLAGGNETFNFQRVAGIAAFHMLIDPVPVPAGTAGLLDVARSQFPEGAAAPFRYSSAQFHALAAIPLDRDRTTVLQPNPIAVLHPLSYVPQVIAYWLGAIFDLPPLVLFYLGRLAGLAAAIGLTAVAIRQVPAHKYAFAALALLPTITFSRSTLDADQLTNGLAFLFVAYLLREIVAEGPIRMRSIVLLAGMAFVLAQCKSAYLVLPFFALAIPARRFSSGAARWAVCLLVVLPGLVASLAWMVVLKQTYFAGIRYRTWAGDVDPDRQSAAVLAHPLQYAGIVLQTLFATPLIPQALIGLIGVFGPPVYMPAFLYVVLLVLPALVVMSEANDDGVAFDCRARLLALAIFVAGALLVLTLLYIQWNGFGAPTIAGFQGRYLYPLMPLLLTLLPLRRTDSTGVVAARWLILYATISVASTCWVTWTTYLA